MASSRVDGMLPTSPRRPRDARLLSKPEKNSQKLIDLSLALDEVRRRRDARRRPTRMVRS